MREIVITEAAANRRLDKFLLHYLNKAPKGFIYKMLRKKNITRNGKRADGSEILAVGDAVTLFLSDGTIAAFTETRPVAPAGCIAVIYEDEHLLICDKPAGLLTHADNVLDTDTLVHRVRFYLCQKSEYDPTDPVAFAPTLCNRLDRNTSGLVTCAKTLAAAQWLNKAFAERRVEKRYRAIVCGEITTPGVLSGTMQKDMDNKKAIIRQSQEGTADKPMESLKSVQTHYTPIWHGGGFTVLDVLLITGKFHQIRAHFAHIGHPVAGDVKYGRRSINDRLRRKVGIISPLLHAFRLTFTETAGVLGCLAGKTFEAPLPPMFQQGLDYISQLKKGTSP